MAAGSVIVELLAKTASFETDTARAGKALAKFQKDAQRDAARTAAAFRTSFAGNLLADFAAQAGRAIARLPGEVLASIDAFNDLKDATGASIENISAIDRVARETGVGFDTVKDALVKLNKALNDAKPDSDVARALSAIGLSAKELKALDPAEALRRVAVALSGYADDGHRARLIQELLGRSAAELAPLLVDLAKQGSLVASTTTAQAEEAEKFRKELFKLNADVQDLARSFVGDLLPAMSDFIAKMKELFGGAKTAHTLTTEVRNLEDNIKRLQNLEGKGFTFLGYFGSEAERKKELKKLEGELVDASRKLGAIQVPNPFAAFGGDPVAPSVRMAAKKEKGQKPKDDFGPLLKRLVEMDAGLRATLESEEKLSAAQEAGAKIAADVRAGLIKLTEAQGAQLDALLESAKASERAIELRDREKRANEDAAHVAEAFFVQQAHIRDTYLEEATAAREALVAFGLSREEVDKLSAAKLRASATALEHKAILREERDELDPVSRLYREQAAAIRAAADARDALTAKEHALTFDALTGATQAVKDYLAENEKAGRQTYDLIKGTFDGLENAGVQALTSGKWKDAAKSLVDQVLAEVYRLYIIKPLLNSIFGGGGSANFGSLLSAFSSLFGGSSGASGASTVGMSYASGTNYVPNDGLAFLHKGEAVLTAPQNRAGRGNVTFNIVNNGQPVTAREESRQESSQGTMINLVLDALVSDVQKGGKSHRALSSTYGLNRAAGAKKRA